MKKLLVGLGTAAVCGVLVFVGLSVSGGKASPTPTHVVAQFVDGLNNGDVRQVCETIDPAFIKKAFTTLQGCEEYWTQNLAQGVFFGIWGGYKVIPHTYHVSGKIVTVKFQYQKQTPLTAILVKTKHGWKIEQIYA